MKKQKSHNSRSASCCYGISFLTLLCLFLFSNAHAQKEANNWFFGNGAGLDFNQGDPIPTSISPAQAVRTVMSDPVTGELLFYASVNQVWNRNHELMLNGEEVGGFYVVPVPGSDHLYYLFNMEKEDYRPPGANFTTTIPHTLYCHIIDLSLEGGLGGVVPASKKILLDISLAGKLAAVPHTNGKDFWLVAHEYGNNKYRVASITEEGISVFNTQAIGEANGLGTGIDWHHTGAWGFLKASPDGKKLAATIDAYSTPPSINLFDFDASTGTISNYIPIHNPGIPYGISFSPDNSKLYISVNVPGRGDIQNLHNIVYQYDLSTYTAEAINTSALGLIYENPYTNVDINQAAGGDPYFSLQLGPDGRIYGGNNWAMPQPNTKRYHLLVIDQPNKKGYACSINFKLFDFGEAQAGSILPNFIESYFNGLTPAENPNIPCTSELAFRLYPNPTKEFLNLDLLEQCSDVSIEVSVYNIIGQEVSSFTLNRNGNSLLDLSQYASGTYVLVFQLTATSETSSNSRIIKRVIKL